MARVGQTRGRPTGAGGSMASIAAARRDKHALPYHLLHGRRVAAPVLGRPSMPAASIRSAQRIIGVATPMKGHIVLLLAGSITATLRV